MAHTSHGENPLGIEGLEFLELAAPEDPSVRATLRALGFARIGGHRERPIRLYRQNGIRLLCNESPEGAAAHFAARHGTSVSSLGWRVRDARAALESAVARGAEAVAPEERDLELPALRGVGDTLIYLVERGDESEESWKRSFVLDPRPEPVRHKGFLTVDHVTVNVTQGSAAEIAAFYREVFGFEEIQSFDVRGEKTGLVSYALRSPCGSFCIPVNEGTGSGSQIEEYLRAHHGPGVQHVALATGHIVGSLRALADAPFSMLKPEPSYYDTAFRGLERMMEDPEELRELSVLVCGEDDSYLLQRFTENLFGAVFVEFIQRVNNNGFGQGNFEALFRTIEREQLRRGAL